jgi:hypothetical protein
VLAGDDEAPPAIIQFQWAPASEPEPIAAAVIEAAIDDAHASVSQPLTLAWQAPESGPPETC